jgi:hypothetical protein
MYSCGMRSVVVDRAVPVVCLVIVCGLSGRPAQARQQTEAASARVGFTSSDDAVAPPDEAEPPAPPPDVRLGDLPLRDRTDAFTSVAEYLPGVLGTADGMRLRGGSAAGIATFIDGFRVYHLRPPLPFLKRADVFAAGYGVAWGDLTDGAITWTSRRAKGGVDVQIDLFHDQQDVASGPPSSELSFGSDATTQRQAEILTGAVSAPLGTDRLVATVGVSLMRGQGDGTSDVEGVLPRTPDVAARSTDGTLSLSWQASERHEIELLTAVSASGFDNGGALGVQPEAQPSREARGHFAGLRWSGKLTDRLDAHALAGWEHRHADLEPRFCRDNPEGCDSVSAIVNQFPRRIVYGNGLLRERSEEDRVQASAGLLLRLGAGSAVDQRVRLQGRIERDVFEAGSATPSGRIQTFNGASVPQDQTTSFSGDPRAVGGWTDDERQALAVIATLEDEVQLWRRLWLRPGIGLVAGHVTGPGEQVVVKETAPTYALGLGWDALGDGRTWLRAGAARRIDSQGDGARGQTQPSPVTQRCLWDPVAMTYTSGCVVSGGTAGNTVGLPCGPTGVDDNGVPCTHAPGLPRSTEITAGARQALGKWFWLDLDLVYRRTSNLVGVTETNRIWNFAGPAISGFRNGRAQEVFDTTSSDDNHRRYRGVTLGFGARVGGFAGLLAYTYSRQDVNGIGRSNPWGDIPGRAFGIGTTGADPDERRHSVRFAGHYDIARVVSLGLTYRYDSGPPYDRSFQATGGSYGDYRARRGINPGTDVNDPADDVTVSNPGTERLNFQVRFRVGRWIPFGMDLYADVINLFDGREGSLDAGRWTRLGAEFRY